MTSHLPQNLSDQLKYAMYLPALFPPYATAAIAKSNKFRPMPNGLEPKDLNFLDPTSKLFYLPAALYSAGHERDLTKPQQTMVTRRTMKDNLFFGDSGGYQIISGKLNANSNNKRKAITGVHSDIGGWYSERGLSDISLKWMLTKAGNCGLRLKKDWDTNLKCDPFGTIHNSRTGFWIFWSKVQRAIPENSFIHNSVIERMETTDYEVPLPIKYKVAS